MSDDQARNDIITNLKKNYFVEAGAGSGKTTILVERMVAMVEQGFPVERICTITFTKAAANEFYERFQRRLSERSKDGKKDDYHPGQLIEQTVDTKANCAKALQNIDSCFMGTIDSFCNMILSEHPLEAGIPASSTVIEESEIVDSYVREYSNIDTDAAYISLREKNKLFESTQRNALKSFKAIVSEIIKIRDAEFVYDKPVPFKVEEKYMHDKADLLKFFEMLLKNRECAYATSKGKTDEGWDVLENNKTRLLRDDWDLNFPNIVYVLKEIRDKKIRLKPLADIDKRFGPSFARLQAHTDGRSKTQKISWYELSDDGFSNIVTDLQDYQARIAIDFVCDCVGLMSQVLRKKGLLTYFDYKLYLRDMLKKDAAGDHKLIDHIYKRHSYFLIDEFQDTDPMQAEIFFYLAAESFDADWRKCKPKPGSLFIVGDPKQSIYRFKNADVASFKNVRSLFNGTNGEVLNLTSNFRSTHKLHEWFNDLFGNYLLSTDTQDQSKYELIQNQITDKSGYVNGIYKFTPKDIKDDTAEVLSIVNTLVENPDYLLGYEEKDKNEKKVWKERELRYSDIMIITAAKKDLNKYARIFTEEHIPFRIEGDMDFNECQAMKDLVAFYKASVFPDNNFYVYEALISRLFNISSDTAMAIRDELGKIPSTGCFVSNNSDVQNAIKQINDYHDLSKKLSASALMAKMIDDLQLFSVSGNYNQEYVYYALELLRSAEANGEIASAEEAVGYLERIMTREEKLERCPSLEKNDNRIHLANLHKVKGLEATVVILAGSKERATGVRVNKRVEYLGDTPKCYMFGISEIGLKFKDENRKEAEKESVEAERIRQLYVAATRAKSVLIMADAQPWKKLIEPEKNCKFDFPELQYRQITVKEPEAVDGNNAYENNKSIIKDTSSSRTSSIKIHKPSNIEFEEIDEAYETINTKRNPKLIGTLVHKMMEVIVSSENKVDVSRLIKDLCKGLDTQSDHYYSDILNNVNVRIQNGGYSQDNGMDADILKELLSADEKYCEVPFSYRNSENSITTGIIDVLYRKGEDWFIADYKTNADGNDLDQKYQSQLAEYARAAREMVNRDVVARVYHIDV